MKKKNAKPEKNYGIELFRIIAMLMIIISHILYHGGLEAATKQSGTLIQGIVLCLKIATFCAVNCYAIISGYLGINKRIKYGNIAALWLRVLLYSASIAIIAKIVSPDLVDTKTLLFSFLPISTNEYWYFSAYIALFIFAPALNLFIEKSTKKQAKTTLLSLLLIGIISTRLIGKDPFVLSRGYSAIWLMIIYLLGAYIKKYNILIKWKKKKLILGYLICILLTLGTKYLLSKVKFGLDSSFLISYTSPTMVLSSIFLLLFFVKTNIKNTFLKKIILAFSTASFSVYIIHDNPIIRKAFISNKFVGYTTLPAPIIVPAILGTAIAIYIACYLIDYIRSKIINEQKIKKYVDIKFLI